MGPPHCLCHYNSQLLMADGGWVVPPYCSCHLNFQLLWLTGVGGSSLLLMSLHLSTVDG